jgi:TRAP-type C4-dicarboxylate transport system substrate-binding protein
MKTLSTFVITVALIVGLVGCAPAPTQYNLTISSTEGGSVTTPGEGTGSFTYDEGKVVDLVAEAEEGYQFVNWTGDVDTVANINAASTTITMNDNYSITANFYYVGPRTVIELDFITFFPSGDFQAAVGHQKYMDTIADRVLAETDDYEINWNVFYGATEPPGQIYSLVRDGVYDIGVTAPIYSRGIFPLWEGPEYPGDLYRNNAYTMSLTIQALYDEFSPLQNEMAAQNLKVMHFWSTGPGYFFMTEGNEVRTLADFPGKTIRVSNLGSAYAIEALGAEPLLCTMPEAKEKFEAGLLHGILCPGDMPKGFGLDAYVKHCTFAPFSYQVVFMKVMNTAAWNALPAEVQTIFDEVNAAWPAYYGQLRTWGEADGLEYCYDEIPGFTVYDLRAENPTEYNRWVAACDHCHTDWIGTNTTRQDLWDKYVELDEYYATIPPYSTWTPGASPPPVPTFP